MWSFQMMHRKDFNKNQTSLCYKREVMGGGNISQRNKKCSWRTDSLHRVKWGKKIKPLLRCQKQVKVSLFADKMTLHIRDHQRLHWKITAVHEHFVQTTEEAKSAVFLHTNDKQKRGWRAGRWLGGSEKWLLFQRSPVPVLLQFQHTHGSSSSGEI